MNAAEGLTADMARDLRGLFMLADITEQDTIKSALAKSRNHGSEYHLLFPESGGMVCLCTGAAMSRRIMDAIHGVGGEQDAGCCGEAAQP